MFVRFITTEPESLQAWRGIKEMRVSYRPLLEGELWHQQNGNTATGSHDEVAADVDQPVDPDDHQRPEST